MNRTPHAGDKTRTLHNLLSRYGFSAVLLWVGVGLLSPAPHQVGADEATPGSSIPFQTTDVFIAGEDGYHTYRIPAVVAAANGDLLAFAEGRVNGRGDAGNIDLVMKRSTDGGRTWGDLQVIAEDGTNTVGNPAPVVDRATGDVLLLVVKKPGDAHEGDIRNDQGGYCDPYLLRSIDHGATWTGPVSLAETCDRDDWRWYATGPCHAIQLRHGDHAGRLVVPANFSRVGSGGNDHLGAHALLSDDGGHTWRIGAVDASYIGDNTLNPNESTVAELADGRLMFNCRDQHGTSRATRAVTFSDDGGETFTGPYTADERLVAPVCQASLLTVDQQDGGQLIVFSGASEWDSRSQMQLRVSADAGRTWHDGPVLHAGSAAYSDLVALAPETIGCLFEADNYGRIVFTRVPVASVSADLE